METKKKKKLYNALMIAGIVLFMMIGIAGIGVSQGWFGNEDDKVITADKDSGKAVYTESTEKPSEKLETEMPSEDDKMTENNAISDKNDGNAPNNNNEQTVTDNSNTQNTAEQKETTAPVTQAPVVPAPASESPTQTPIVSTPTPVPSAKTCKITIQCTTILNSMDKLDPAKHSFVPKDGYILKNYVVEVKNGDVVFDVLKRACDEKGIQLEYAFTPIYNSYYIEGINHLYEFDCGNQSGWMYKINNGLPQYGSSSCEVKENDNVVWLYSCEGLGADVGGSVN